MFSTLISIIGYFHCKHPRVSRAAFGEIPMGSGSQELECLFKINEEFRLKPSGDEYGNVILLVGYTL